MKYEKKAKNDVQNTIIEMDKCPKNNTLYNS